MSHRLTASEPTTQTLRSEAEVNVDRCVGRRGASTLAEVREGQKAIRAMQSKHATAKLLKEVVADVRALPADEQDRAAQVLIAFLRDLHEYQRSA